MLDDPPGLAPENLRRYRLQVLPVPDRRHLLLPEEVAAFIVDEVASSSLQGECLGAIFVDDLASPLGWNLPFAGYLGLHRVAPQKFISPALLLGAEGLLLFRHRGAREPRATRRDVRIARRVLRAGQLTGLNLLDYLVLGDGSWISLKGEECMRFPSLGDRPPRDGRAIVKPKYRNPDDPSETWSGRGKMARWLSEKVAAGASLADFAVEE